MAPKRYTWIKLDDQFPDHPKVVGLSDAGFATFVRGLCYCSRFQTDGAIPKPMLARGIGTTKTSRELVAAGLWEATPDGWLVHDYTDHQRTSAEIEAEREKWRRKKAGQREVSPGDNEGDRVGESTESPADVPPPVVSVQSTEVSRTSAESLALGAEAGERDPRVTEALSRMADEGLARGTNVGNPAKFRAKCLANATEQHGTDLDIIAEDYPDETADQLRKRLKDDEEPSWATM